MYEVPSPYLTYNPPSFKKFRPVFHQFLARKIYGKLPLLALNNSLHQEKLLSTNIPLTHGHCSNFSVILFLILHSIFFLHRVVQAQKPYFGTIS